jgi:hypothetical protein
MSRPKVFVKDEEETKAYLLLDTDHFSLKWPHKSVDTFASKVQELIWQRKEYAGIMYTEIMKRMKFIVVKDEDLNINNIDYTETVLAFAEQFLKYTKIDMTPKQKTIDEAIASKGKVKPASKDSDEDHRLKEDMKKKKSKK